MGVKNFCASEDANNRAERQFMEWKKNLIPDMGLISRIYTALLHLNNIKTNKSIENEQGLQ